MKIRFILGVLIMLFLLGAMKCGEPPAEDYGGSITSIKFSAEWDPVTGQIGAPSNSFTYGITKVYYEITFEKRTTKGGMVKKCWQLPNNQYLESTSFMPKNSTRICGELHYYDLNNMDAGTYQISVKYCESGVYQEYPYSSSVKRTFTIE